MKVIYVLLAAILFACQPTADKPETTTTQDTIAKEPTPPPPSPKTYRNARFKEVTVEKTGEHTYTIQGKGQIFEANFGWVVEDGHNELYTGHQMTDAGAPDWGNFKFTIEAKKQEPNSTLTLVLFEASAEDGSRKHELPITLE